MVVVVEMVAVKNSDTSFHVQAIPDGNLNRAAACLLREMIALRIIDALRFSPKRGQGLIAQELVIPHVTARAGRGRCRRSKRAALSSKLVSAPLHGFVSMTSA